MLMSKEFLSAVAYAISVNVNAAEMQTMLSYYYENSLTSHILWKRSGETLGSTRPYFEWLYEAHDCFKRKIIFHIYFLIKLALQPIIQIQRRLKQEDHRESKTSLGYTVSFRPS